MRWAVSDPRALVPGSDWGRPDEDLRIVRVSAGAPLPAIDVREPRPGELVKPIPNEFHAIDVTDELDGPIGAVGKKFWELVLSAEPSLRTRVATGSPIRRLEYSDRFVRNPVASRVLREIVATLRASTAGFSTSTEISVRTMHGKDEAGTGLNHCWTDRETKLAVLQGLLSDLGATNIAIVGRGDTGHKRELRVEFEDGALAVLRLDHGVSFLDANAKSGPFPFSKSAAEQVAHLKAAVFDVHARDDEAVPIYVSGVIA